jgi:hypothetical protein
MEAPRMKTGEPDRLMGLDWAGLEELDPLTVGLDADDPRAPRR